MDNPIVILKSKLIIAISRKTSWGKNELENLIDKVYMELLEDMIHERIIK